MKSSSSISPEKAVRRAFWSIKLPSLIAIFASWLVAYSLLTVAEHDPNFESLALRWSILLFAGGFVFGWLIWSLQVPKWRLWAFERVSDIAELKRLAVAQQYIWPEGHFLEKTEIASKELREKIKQLEQAQENYLDSA